MIVAEFWGGPADGERHVLPCWVREHVFLDVSSWATGTLVRRIVYRQIGEPVNGTYRYEWSRNEPAPLALGDS